MGTPRKSTKGKAAKKPNAQSSKSPAKQTNRAKRPSTRSIVRWNDDLDRKLLLSIQSACNSNGIRIPWEDVAENMNGGISDGAIVQHLAKMRSRMADQGLDVPPPLRRGGPGPSRSSNTATKRNRPNKSSKGPTQDTSEDELLAAMKREDDDGDSDAYEEPSKKKGKTRQNRTRQRKNSTPTSKVMSIGENQPAEGSVMDTSSDTESTEDTDTERYVGTGAEYLKYPNAESSSSSQSESPKSMIVKLRMPQAYFDRIIQDERASAEATTSQAVTGEAAMDIEMGAAQDAPVPVEHQAAIAASSEIQTQPPQVEPVNTGIPPAMGLPASSGFHQASHPLMASPLNQFQNSTVYPEWIMNNPNPPMDPARASFPFGYNTSPVRNERTLSNTVSQYSHSFGDSSQSSFHSISHTTPYLAQAFPDAHSEFPADATHQFPSWMRDEPLPELQPPELTWVEDLDFEFFNLQPDREQ
ncbi:hypothetical protein FQN57_003341 [Myotisia sp. PD_48]|nr:hypothetical protein FQN57_003341 [Myotisia sp. PD_48]